MRSRLAAKSAAAGFAILLGFFIAFRAVLIMIPIDLIDPFQKSFVGSLTALALLLLQPFACSLLAMRRGVTSSGAWWAFGGGVLSSLFLLVPALLLFME